MRKEQWRCERPEMGCRGVSYIQPALMKMEYCTLMCSRLHSVSYCNERTLRHNTGPGPRAHACNGRWSTEEAVRNIAAHVYSDALGTTRSRPAVCKYFAVIPDSSTRRRLGCGPTRIHHPARVCHHPRLTPASESLTSTHKRHCIRHLTKKHSILTCKRQSARHHHTRRAKEGAHYVTVETPIPQSWRPTATTLRTKRRPLTLPDWKRSPMTTRMSHSRRAQRPCPNPH